MGGYKGLLVLSAIVLLLVGCSSDTETEPLNESQTESALVQQNNTNSTVVNFYVENVNINAPENNIDQVEDAIDSEVAEESNTEYECDCALTCDEMTCDEAQYQLNICGCSRRDGDGDGLACDSKCS